MKRLPLTVISGYLGAGKTTLINRLLAEPHGLRLLVMVNDFGAINIDQSLIDAQDEDVIALTNGCICCTMGTDLFLALGDALDRRPRPDHLIIEASGIADPAAIANTAIAEPELDYAGVITLVDAININTLLDDPLVSPQVAQQMSAADMLVQTKSVERVAAVDEACAARGLALPLVLDADTISLLTLDGIGAVVRSDAATHPAYVTWHQRGGAALDHTALRSALENRPEGVYRLKGFVRTDEGLHEVHVVGKHHDIRVLSGDVEASVVALGVQNAVSVAEISAWWDEIPDAVKVNA